ncbi:MAG: ATP-binding protein [Alphaproteobacteria bacterium]
MDNGDGRTSATSRVESGAPPSGIARGEPCLGGWSGVLRLLAGGAPLRGILEALVRAAETAAPGMIGSILLLDGRTLRHGAAPGLPDWYSAAIEGAAIGQGLGSCGSAAHTGRRVIVTDIATHPYWEPYRAIALRAGLRACWSEPVVDSAGDCIGTFGMYYRSVREPSEHDLRLIEEAAHIAGIAIERHRSEARLLEATAAAEAASAAKSAFLAHMSHELRTPLNAIIGFADMLEAEIFGPLGSTRNREYVRDIRESGSHLLDIVTSLLELARIEAGSDDGTEIDPEALTAEIVDEAVPRANRKAIALARTVPAGLPPLCSDPTALHRILALLLDNAVRYTPDGGHVEIAVRQQPSGTGGAYLAFRIADDGPGMSPDRLAQVREPFAGAGGLVSRPGSGLGVGIAIADRLARALGGTLGIESGGRGTAVTVAFPVGP